MWELDHKESWALKNWCFWTVVLEKTLESHLVCKEIKPVNPKGNQSWIFIRWTDAEAPIFWPPDVKNWLIGKDCDSGKDWRQEEKGITGWDGWMASSTQWTWVWAAPRVGDGQGSLRAAVYGIAKSRTQLSDWTELKARTIISPNVIPYQPILFYLLCNTFTFHPPHFSYLLVLKAQLSFCNHGELVPVLLDTKICRYSSALYNLFQYLHYFII